MQNPWHNSHGQRTLNLRNRACFTPEALKKKIRFGSWGKDNQSHPPKKTPEALI
jgi:hypothetical protein